MQSCCTVELHFTRLVAQSSVVLCGALAHGRKGTLGDGVIKRSPLVIPRCLAKLRTKELTRLLLSAAFILAKGENTLENLVIMPSEK